MKVKAFWWLVAGLAAVRLALMAVVPVFEPSEARYAAISANMARSGDFVIPRFTHNLEYQSFDGKPPLVFQAGGLFCRAFGVNEFAVRLFPFLSAVLLLAILYHAVKRESDAETGRLAVLVCATCTAFYAAAGVSMTDMSLTCCVAGALLLYRCFQARCDLRYAMCVAALLGAGMLVKGPVALVMFGLPVLLDAAVNRRWKAVFNWRWMVAVPVFFAVAAPWFVLSEQRNPGSVWYFFYNENFMRFISHDYGDKYGAGREAFRGVSILWAVVATLPWPLIPRLRNNRIDELSNNRIGEDGKSRSPHSTIPSFTHPLIRLFDYSSIRSFPHSIIPSFYFLSLFAIMGFWCLTSRVLVYYLFPVIPLFAAGFTLWLGKARLTRFVPWCALVSAVVVTGALVGGMFLSDKMRGAATEFSVMENHYACEFYHGRKSDAELAKLRVLRDELKARRKAARAAREAERK